MYLYYDRAGNLREIINDANRQRNINYNEIYVYVEPSADQPQPEDGVYKLPAQWNTANAAFTRNGVDLVGSLTSMSKITIDEIPYNKERDLKYFKYFAKYQVFMCTIPSSVYASAGIVTATVQLADTVDNVENTLTAFSFNVEATTGVKPDSTMTVAQYDYLFNLVNHMNDVVLENIAIIDRTDAATFNALAVGRVFYDTHDNLYYIKTDTSPYYLEYDQGLLANARTILRFANLDEQYQLTEIHSMTDGRLSVIEVDGTEYLIAMSSNAHIVAYALFHKCWYEYSGVSSYPIGCVFQDEYKKDIADKGYVDDNIFEMTSNPQTLTDDEYNFVLKNNARILYDRDYYEHVSYNNDGDHIFRQVPSTPTVAAYVNMLYQYITINHSTKVATKTYYYFQTYSKTQIDNKIAALGTVLSYKGSKTVAELNALTGQVDGDVYNVSDAGTLTAGGVTVLAGDNVVWTSNNVWDKLAGTVDLSGYVPTNRTIAGINLGSNITAQALTDALVFASNSDIDNMF